MTTKTYEITDLPTHYLKCRTFGHAWEEFVPVGMRAPQFGFRFSLLCTSCASERHDLVNTQGQLLQREYRYQAGYELGFSLPRDEARLEFERRTDRKRAVRRGKVLKMVR